MCFTFTLLFSWFLCKKYWNPCILCRCFLYKRCNQNEVRQLTAKLETLQKKKNIDQRNRQVEHLENENRAIQFQVGEVDLNLCMYVWRCEVKKKYPVGSMNQAHSP